MSWKENESRKSTSQTNEYIISPRPSFSSLVAICVEIFVSIWGRGLGYLKLGPLGNATLWFQLHFYGCQWPPTNTLGIFAHSYVLHCLIVYYVSDEKKPWKHVDISFCLPLHPNHQRVGFENKLSVRAPNFQQSQSQVPNIVEDSFPDLNLLPRSINSPFAIHHFCTARWAPTMNKFLGGWNLDGPPPYTTMSRNCSVLLSNSTSIEPVVVFS